MERPVGVTVLAVLQYLGAAFLVLMGVLMMVAFSVFGPAIMKAAGAAGSVGGMAMAGLGVFLGILFFFFVAIAALLGWGMWGLKNWARIVTMVLSALGLLGAAFGLLSGLMHFSVVILVVATVRAAINGLILWYLNEPNVKQAFA